MIRHYGLEHQFVKYIPENLEPGVLYISMEYATAAHSCCCGCGEEVITPFTPTDWRMTFDGETVSLWPSIGNWNLPCRSHYVIRRDRVIEADVWSDQQITAERLRDKAAKAAYFRGLHPLSKQVSPTATSPEPIGLWQRILRWLLKPSR